MTRYEETYWTRGGKRRRGDNKCQKFKSRDQSLGEGRTPRGTMSFTTAHVRKERTQNAHFFHTILMLEALPGLNFFLAVDEVLSSSLTLR